MKSRKEILIENITNYLRECVEAAEECCGSADDINYKPAKKAFDEMMELRAMLEVST